jgi:type VII secretion integral membrane protein EccD
VVFLVDVLTRITVASPQRRVDLALPADVPLAELLPDLLQRAGDGLADQGQQHGGWVLHRFGGARIAATESMAAAGVRDGEVLHLLPARTGWPEPEYDDVVDEIAVRSRRLGARWSGATTRIAAVLAAGAVLLVGLVSIGGAGAPVLGLAAVLLGAGVLASRAYGEPLVGVALSAYSLPAAFVGGLHLLGVGSLTPSHLIVATTALVVWAVAGALGAGGVPPESGRSTAAGGLWIFVGGAAAGLLGSTAAMLATATDAARAAAVLLVAAVAGGALAPSLAIRLGRLPLPVVTLPPGADPVVLGARPDRDRVLAAVARSDAMLTGLLLGVAVAATGGAWVLRDAGPAALALTLVAGLALLLRARLLVTVRQRAPLLAGGTAMLLMPFATGAVPLGRLAVPVLAVVVVGLAAAGVRYRRRAPSPYLGRAADIVEVLCLISVIPLAAGVLDLYAAMRGLSG